MKDVAMSGGIFGCNWGILLASSRQRTEILLNILQCTRKATTKNYPSPDINCFNSDEVEKHSSITIAEDKLINL